MLPVTAVLVRQAARPVLSLFRALDGTVASYRDGDFSFGLTWDANDELGDLVRIPPLRIAQQAEAPRAVPAAEFTILHEDTHLLVIDNLISSLIASALTY